MRTFWENLEERKTGVAIYTNAAVAVITVIYLLILPVGILVQDLNDPGLRSGKIPAFAFRWHQSLSKRYQPWAVQRVASGHAAQRQTRFAQRPAEMTLGGVRWFEVAR